jgi:hypothetical protein
LKGHVCVFHRYSLLVSYFDSDWAVWLKLDLESLSGELAILPREAMKGDLLAILAGRDNLQLRQRVGWVANHKFKVSLVVGVDVCINSTLLVATDMDGRPFGRLAIGQYDLTTEAIRLSIKFTQTVRGSITGTQ